MQTVDMVIAGVGVVALLATTLGVVFYEEAAGEQEVDFPEAAYDIEDSETGVGAGTYTFEFDLRDNATATSGLQVVIGLASGNAVPQASGQYEVRISTPNGTCPSQTAAFSSSSRTINIPECRWASPPAHTHSTDPSSLDLGVKWATPLTIEVTINNPSAPLGQPGCVGCTYDITVSGGILTYAAVVETPEVGSR